MSQSRDIFGIAQVYTVYARKGSVISRFQTPVAVCIMSICTVSRQQHLDQPNEDFRSFISQNWLTIFNATSPSGCDHVLSARRRKPGFKLALHILLNPLAELPNAAHKAAT